MIDASVLGLTFAFGGGILSFLSPCVLPLMPDYLAYVAGASSTCWTEFEIGRD